MLSLKYCVLLFSIPFVTADGLVYFEDLMDESCFATSITLLEKDYAEAFHDNGDLDERIFINEDESLLVSGSLSGGAISMNGNGAKVNLPTNSAISF